MGGYSANPHDFSTDLSFSAARFGASVSAHMKSPRRAAVSILRAWAKGHVYAESLIERHASRNELSPQDRGLLNAIVLGVLRHKRLLDHWIATLRKGKLDDETRDILRVGLCQLLILQLPDHAAVFETVELGKSAVRGL
ncbi:MAG: sun protein, partial [Akkermansiaceae bacterium]|nr:sun protein [Akkermansiaceae bacterium]